MTPEQEDAHWALMGKPLMRAWRLYRQELEAAHDYTRKARQRLAMDDQIGAAVLSGYADEARDTAMRIWTQYGFHYAVKGAEAGGVFYSNEEGMSHD